MQKHKAFRMHEASGEKVNLKTNTGKFHGSEVAKNLSSLFIERHTHLMNQCKRLNMPLSTKEVGNIIYLAPGPFKFCFILKVSK